jgi:hypothetical protein
VREFYLRANHQLGLVLVMECDDVTEAERLVAALPISEAELLNFEVIPLRPYMGFTNYLKRINDADDGTTARCRPP